MSRKLNPLAKASALYLISTIIGQGITFLGMMVFTRLMSQTDYGIYSTYYAYVSILVVFVGANLYVPLNNAYIDHADRVHAYRKSVLMLSTLIMGGIALVALVIRGWLFPELTPYLIIVGILHAYGFFIVNYRMYSANMETDYKKKSALLIWPYVLQFGFGLIFVLLFPEMSFPARATGSSLGLISCGAIAYIEMMRSEGKLFVASDWKYALKISVPSMAMSVSYMLMQQCDKAMITEMCSADDTAVYSVLYYLGYALIVVNQAVGAVREAWVYRQLGNGKLQGVKPLQKWYLFLMAVLATGVLMLAPEVIQLLVPENYWEYGYVAPFVTAACMMVLYGFYMEIAGFYKRNTQISICVMTAAAINIGLNVVLIPILGAVVAAYTTVVAYAVLMVLSYLIVRKEAKGAYSLWVFLAFGAYICCAGGIYVTFCERILVRYAIFGVILLGAMAFAFIKRNVWIPMLLKRGSSAEA